MPDQFWEVVYAGDQNRDITQRAKVPGGWLYRSTVWHGNGTGITTALVFVPEEETIPSKDSAYAVARPDDGSR